MSAALPRHHEIARALRDEILRGRYQAGQRLPAERELAQRLSVNRGSVREALRRLEQQGLVAIRHGDGATVLALDQASLEVIPHMLLLDGQLDRALLEEVLEVHEMLIVGAARLAVERATADERREARELLERLAAPETSDERYLDTVVALLDLIAEAARNRVLKRARRALDPLFAPRFRETRKRLRAPQAVIEPHARAIQDALEAADPDAAATALRRFLRLNRRRALDAALRIQQAGNPDAPPTPERIERSDHVDRAAR